MGSRCEFIQQRKLQTLCQATFTHTMSSQEDVCSTNAATEVLLPPLALAIPHEENFSLLQVRVLGPLLGDVLWACFSLCT